MPDVISFCSSACVFLYTMDLNTELVTVTVENIVNMFLDLLSATFLLNSQLLTLTLEYMNVIAFFKAMFS